MVREGPEAGGEGSDFVAIRVKDVAGVAEEVPEAVADFVEDLVVKVHDVFATSPGEHFASDLQYVFLVFVFDYGAASEGEPFVADV